MISFDALTLKAFTEENKDFLCNSKIQKIQQPTRRELIIWVRKAGISRRLYININPNLYHICFISEESEKKRRIEIPQKPPMFCMQLRKYLENSTIVHVNQPENERIFEIYIQSYNELNEKIYLCLAIELMGKYSNIILYNANTNIIVGCAHNVGEEKSRQREIAGTLPYIYPPKQNKLDIRTYSGLIDYDNLSNKFYLFSNHFSKLCSGKSLDEIIDYINLKNLSPSISSDYKEYSLFSELISESISQDSVNVMIDNYYSYHQEQDKYNALKNFLFNTVDKQQKKIINSIAKMQAQIQKESVCCEYRKYGDLIMSNLYSNKDYSENITVYDWNSSENLSIKLDSSKTLKENANRFYKLYNKGKTSKAKLSELCCELKQTKEYLDQIKYSINAAVDYDDLIDIEPELIKTSPQKKAKLCAVEPKKITQGNFIVYIGKNNRQNDYIVSKLAKEDDLWFHTKDCAGSHVLLKGENPTDEIILFCAKLAKKYSSCSDSSKVGVIYTRRKYLKKPPKANLGYVIYRNEKEIVVE